MIHVDPAATEAAESDLANDGIDVVRLGYSDIIGAERGRDILTRRFARTVGDGVAFCRSVYGTSWGKAVIAWLIELLAVVMLVVVPVLMLGGLAALLA